jgi:hypothetical protein
MGKGKKIKLDVFKCNVHLIITDDPNKYLDDRGLRMYCCDSPDEDMTKDCGGFVFQKDKADYYAVFPPTIDERYDTVCHESVHLIGRIFRDRGQLADYGNDELFAYFVGWIAGEIAGFIKKALL